jgi:chromosome segregation ATPase
MLSAEDAEAVRSRLLVGWGDTLVALVNEQTAGLEKRLDELKTIHARELEARRRVEAELASEKETHELRNRQLSNAQDRIDDLRVRGERCSTQVQELIEARNQLLADLTRVTEERDTHQREVRRLEAALRQVQIQPRSERAFHAALAATEGGRGQLDHDDLRFTLEVLEGAGWLRDPEVEAS